MTDLEKLISTNSSRKVTREEIAAVMGVSIATFARRKAGRFTADELIRVARHFAISPTLLLVDYGVLTPEDAAKAGQQFGMSGLSDSEILEELMGRAAEREVLTGQVATHRTHLVERKGQAYDSIPQTGDDSESEQPVIPQSELDWMHREAAESAQSKEKRPSATPRSTRKSPTGQ